MPVGEVTVTDGIITHPASGRSTSYGKVAAAAAKLTPPDPKSIKLKNPREWKIAGKPMKRLDTAPKVNGSMVYSIDLKLPGMVYAAATTGRHFAPDALAREVLAGRDRLDGDLVPVAREFLGDELRETGMGALAHLRAGDTDDAGVVGLDDHPRVDLGIAGAHGLRRGRIDA